MLLDIHVADFSVLGGGEGGRLATAHIKKAPTNPLNYLQGMETKSDWDNIGVLRAPV